MKWYVFEMKTKSGEVRHYHCLAVDDMEAFHKADVYADRNGFVDYKMM